MMAMHKFVYFVKPVAMDGPIKIGCSAVPMLTIEVEREDDGRWVAEVLELPGALAYGATETEARTKAAALAFRVIADQVEHGEAA